MPEFVCVSFDDRAVLEFFDDLRVTGQIVRIDQVIRRYAADGFAYSIAVALIDDRNS